MRIHVRYETPDETGKTRRERNADFGKAHETPEFDLPENGEYLWSIYWDVSARVRRVIDGSCYPIAPSEFLAWSKLSGTIVHAPEYAILCAIDEAFCAETSAEIAAYNARQKAKAEQEAQNR